MHSIEAAGVALLLPVVGVALPVAVHVLQVAAHPIAAQASGHHQALQATVVFIRQAVLVLHVHQAAVSAPR